MHVSSSVLTINTQAAYSSFGQRASCAVRVHTPQRLRRMSLMKSRFAAPGASIFGWLRSDMQLINTSMGMGAVPSPKSNQTGSLRYVVRQRG